MTADLRPVPILLSSTADVVYFRRKVNQWVEEIILNHPFNSKVVEIQPEMLKEIFDVQTLSWHLRSLLDKLKNVVFKASWGRAWTDPCLNRRLIYPIWVQQFVGHHPSWCSDSTSSAVCQEAHQHPPHAASLHSGRLLYVRMQQKHTLRWMFIKY